MKFYESQKEVQKQKETYLKKCIAEQKQRTNFLIEKFKPYKNKLNV